MNADQLLDNYNELQKIELRKNLNTYTLKELKKEIIKMKADKFAVTKMKRRQIIELIVQYHYLFPHLLTKQGSKGTKRKPNNTKGNKQKPNLPQLTHVPNYSTNSMAPSNTQLRPLAQKHLENLYKLTNHDFDIPFHNHTGKHLHDY